MSFVIAEFSQIMNAFNWMSNVLQKLKANWHPLSFFDSFNFFSFDKITFNEIDFFNAEMKSTNADVRVGQVVSPIHLSSNSEIKR